MPKKTERCLKVQRIMPKEKCPHTLLPKPVPSLASGLWYEWKPVTCFAENRVCYYVYYFWWESIRFYLDLTIKQSDVEETAKRWVCTRAHTHTCTRSREAQVPHPFEVKKKITKTVEAVNHWLSLRLHVLTLKGIYWLSGMKNEKIGPFIFSSYFPPCPPQELILKKENYVLW